MGYKRDAFVTSLSRGMTQRLGLARVLLHDPKVLLLDEPASGLDPRARIEIRGLLKELGKMGKTIMVSSHILPELADICNKVGIIERGELQFNGTVSDLMKQIRQRMLLNVVRGRRSGAGRAAVGAEHLVEKVEIKDGHISVTLARERDRLQRPAHDLDRRRFQADAVPRGRNESGNGVHGADEGDHGVRR